MARSYNRIELIGNLTHDPELRTTPKGTSVCGFSLATDRAWKDEQGEKHEESAFHRIVAWKGLAEQCAKLLRKGRKVFVAGRLNYRSYEKDGTQVPVAEIIIDDMIVLDDKRVGTTAEAVPASPSKRAIPETAEQIYSAEDIAEEIPF